MDQFAQVSALILATPDRHFQRVEGQIRVEAGGDLPADDHAGVHVEDERGVLPAHAGAHVGQVGDPQLVRMFCGEVPFDQVTRASGLGCGPGRARRLVTQQPAQPGLAHQPLDGAPGHSHTASAQLVPELASAVDAVVLRVDPLDHRGQLLIPPGAGAGRSGLGGVVGRRCDLCRRVFERLQDRLDTVFDLLRGRFGVLGPFLAEGEYSGFVFGEDVAVDHAFQLGAGAFDVLR